MAVHGTSSHAVTYFAFSYVFILQYIVISILTVPIKRGVYLHTFNSIHPHGCFPLAFLNGIMVNIICFVSFSLTRIYNF